MRNPKVTKVYRASAAEQAGHSGLYPLYGWVTVNGHRCAVEDLRKSWSKDDPQFEVIAPAGHHFTEYPGASCNDALHTLLCMNLADVRERAELHQVEKCQNEKE